MLCIPSGASATMATVSAESAERKQSEQAEVETERMRSHGALLPVEIRSEWPGHQRAGLCPFTK